MLMKTNNKPGSESKGSRVPGNGEMKAFRNGQEGSEGVGTQAGKMCRIGAYQGAQP